MWSSDTTGDLAEGRSTDHQPSFDPSTQLILLSPQQMRLVISRLGIRLAGAAGLTLAGRISI
jgi:hypothetical protein